MPYRNVEQIEQTLNRALAQRNINVEVLFGKKAAEDVRGYDASTQEDILVLIIRQAAKNPLLHPNGLGEPLHEELSGFAKIKPKKLSLRIVYRPTDLGKILMEVIAIGPREREKVYRMAASRIIEFKEEMAKRR